MKKVLCSILPILAIALVIAMVSGAAFAQDSENFNVNYFANATASGAPSATLRFTEHAGTGLTDVCAMIYVYGADQQPVECCGCHVTQNGLQTINVNTQLLANPLFGPGSVPNNGTILVVAGIPTSGGPSGPKGNNDTACDPANVDTNGLVELDTYLTHIQNKVSTSWPITESGGEEVEEYLSSAELGLIESDCSFVEQRSSGHGVCDCGAFESLK
jgi:hypothetical protein